MGKSALDDTDRRLLNLLQANARHPATELAELIGVSDNTIHNRIERLEENGIITGYTTTVNYAASNLRLYVHFTCTTRIGDRSAVAEQARSLPQVVEVTELMTGQENLQVKAVGTRDDDITHIAEQLDELELSINDENLIRNERTNPIDYMELKEMMAQSP